MGLEAMRAHQGHITKQEFLARLESAGAQIPETRIDDWCEKGLLQRRQSGLGIETGGSVGLYREIAVQQALEIERLFKVKKRAAYVGWQLWWKGYQVDEKYWRPVFENQQAIFRRALPHLAKWLRKATDLDMDTPGHGQAIAPEDFDPSLKLRARNMALDDFDAAVTVLLSASAGLNSEFYVDHTGGDETGYDRWATSTLLGFKQAEKDRVLGEGLNIGVALDDMLRALSSCPEAFLKGGQLFRGSNLASLHAAREDIRNALEAAVMIREATEWIYGRNAFGLGLAAWFAEKAPSSSLAAIIIAWKQVRAREGSDRFLSSPEIAEMRDKSAQVLARSAKLKDAIKSDPLLFAILTKKRLKKAFNSTAEFQKLSREIYRARMK